MAKKKTSPGEEIRKIIAEKEVVFGKEKTIKCIKNGKAKKVFLSSNCPDNLRIDIEKYSKISEIEFEELSYPNDELGIICKKPFSISVFCTLN